jgi:hypothetical protein
MQSFLELHKRPVIKFDPTNPEHRREVVRFLKEGTWGKCPWAFYAPDNLSIKAYATQSLVEFYLGKEFPVENTKPVRGKKSGAVAHKAGKLISIRRGSK